MPKLTNLKPSKVLAALVRLGWVERKTSTGKNPHKVLKKHGNPALITIPFHKGRDVNPLLLESQLKAAGIPLDRFLGALKGKNKNG